MNVKIKMSQHIVDWLESLGYPVTAMPNEMIEGVFLREAEQWEIAPERLEEMVMEGSRYNGSYSRQGLVNEFAN